MDDHIEQRQKKRRKIEAEGDEQSGGTARGIRSVQELRKALRFDGSNAKDVRKGIQSFKEFLQSISIAEDVRQREKLDVLKRYCEEQMPSQSGRNIAFYDLIAHWDSAVQAQDESLLSTIPSVLALFVKVISTQVGFKDYGVALCKDLLQNEQLRLLDRGLTASKTKEHLISPCIRLLTEIMSFDAGAVAALLYEKRNTTYKRLDQFLNRKSAEAEEQRKGSKKPSLRRIAQRYMIATLKYQTSKAKSELINDGTVLKSFLQGIKHDEGDIVLDILDVLEQSVLKDASLSRSIKHRFLSYTNLTSIATLYSFEDESDDITTKVQQRTHSLLRLVCTSLENGILRKQTGWYPPNSTPEFRSAGGVDEDHIDLGLDSNVAPDATGSKTTIRNTQLAAFAQSLHPDANARQMELLLEIFRAAPELVASYYVKKTTFPTDPKPTPQWLGYSALTFSTITLPVPKDLGWSAGLPLMPPPTEIAIESILPRSLDRATSTRCLNMNHEIITLFAIRALSAAFKKLKDVLLVCQQAPISGSNLWQQASVKLQDLFASRCPLMKNIVATYHRTAKSDPTLHEAVVELLALYFKYLPLSAMTEKFDISLALNDVLVRFDSQQGADERQSLTSQLTRLLEVAETSPDTKWWNKPENLTFTPFVSLLRVLTNLKGDAAEKTRMQDSLTKICMETGLLNSKRALNALLVPLAGSDTEHVSDEIFHAIDHCPGRLVRRPVQYEDIVSQLRRQEKEDGPISLLAVVLSEQAKFLLQSYNSKIILPFINQLYANLEAVGEAKPLLDRMKKDIVDSMPKEQMGQTKKLLYDRITAFVEEALPTDVQTKVLQQSGVQVQGENSYDDILTKAFPQTSSLNVTASSLHKWEKQEVEEAIISGTVTGLLTCLDSVEGEIKRQAFLNIQRFMHKLENSDYPGWQSIFMMLGEVIETVREIGIDNPLPSIVIQLAVRCMNVLTQPLSRLFGKVNQFLTKSPVWNVAKLPSYWVDQLLMQEPGYDDGYLEEASWLLSLLGAALRTESDLEILRRTKVFERILAWGASPALPKRLQQMVLELVHHACQVDTRNTLVTRTGILSWLEIQATMHGDLTSIRAALRNKITEGVVKDEFSRWAGVAIEASS